MPTTILIIGSGGREHALAWKIAQSPQLGKLYVASGNAGTAQIAHNVNLAPTDHAGIVAFAKEQAVDLVLVAPDDALAAGLVDACQAAGILAFGPTKAAAQIEASKAFAKELMNKTGVPTAAHATFSDPAAAKAYLAGRPLPQVVKASGLALGKGVIIAHTLAEAQAAVDELSGGAFGAAGSTIVIEDFLTGHEVSTHAFCDGHTTVMFPAAQDHKAIGTGGVGPNTGGMGTYSPVPFMPDERLAEVRERVVEPVLAGLATAGAPFAGVLYPGLMVEGDRLNVLEYNARFGDPETQTYMRRLKTDLVDILLACATGTLKDQPVEWSAEAAVTVIMASEGYPGAYPKGRAISGIDAAEKLPGVVVFHAGTALAEGQLVTAGGRVLGVSATGATLAEARDRAYAAVKCITFEGAQYRTDIADQALAASSET